MDGDLRLVRRPIAPGRLVGCGGLGGRRNRGVSGAGRAGMDHGHLVGRRPGDGQRPHRPGDAGGRRRGSKSERDAVSAGTRTCRTGRRRAPAHPDSRQSRVAPSRRGRIRRGDRRNRHRPSSRRPQRVHLPPGPGYEQPGSGTASAGSFRGGGLGFRRGAGRLGSGRVPGCGCWVDSGWRWRVRR